MLRSLSLNRVGPADTLHLDFDPRLNVLTGDNGLGKTFVLDIAWWVLTGSWPTQPAVGRPGRISLLRARGVGREAARCAEEGLRGDDC
jgi:hypothetical protein